MSLNRTPLTWTGSTPLSTTNLNTEVRDLWNGLESTWDTFTPTWTASTTNPTIGNGSLDGRWLRIGQTVVGCRITLIGGSTTNWGSGTYFFTLPAVPLANTVPDAMGMGTVRDTSAPSTRVCLAYLSSGVTNTVSLIEAATNTFISSSNPWTWGSGDRISIALNSFELS